MTEIEACKGRPAAPVLRIKWPKTSLRGDGVINLRSCPRCRIGDLFDGSDQYGPYKACIQCGYMEYTEKPLSIEIAKAEQLRRRARRY
jgi:hypothetical protein